LRAILRPSKELLHGATFHSNLARAACRNRCGAAAYAAALYHEGKSIPIVGGFSAGGGSDTYSRLIARPFGRYTAQIRPAGDPLKEIFN